MLAFPIKRLRIINYLLVISILVAALLLVRGIINTSISMKRLNVNLTDGKIVKNTSQARKDIMSYSSILTKNPFGSPLEFSPISAKQGSNEVRRGLPANLILVGTVVGPDKLSYAIFEDKSRQGLFKQEVVRFGESVLNYGTLSAIEPASVELRQQTETFTISIVNLKDVNFSRPYSPVSKSSLAKKVGERAYLLNRTKVQQSLDNPEHLLTDARLLPNIKNNKQEGFKMFEVKRGGIYESLGLRNGDILLRVNELEISNPEVAIQAMTALKGMDKINLDIIRNGEKLSMNYEIR